MQQTVLFVSQIQSIFPVISKQKRAIEIRHNGARVCFETLFPTDMTANC